VGEISDEAGLRAKLKYEQPFPAEHLAGDHECSEEEVLNLACEVLSQEHGVSESELRAATHKVWIAQRDYLRELDPLFRTKREDGRVLWQASEKGQLPQVRERLERFAAALHEMRESLTDLFGYEFCDEESLEVATPMDDAALRALLEHLIPTAKTEHFADLWEAVVELDGKIEVPKKMKGGTAVVATNWERLAAQEAARIWRAKGGTVRRIKDRGEGMSPFYRFARPWLRILGSELPGQALRTVCKK